MIGAFFEWWGRQLWETLPSGWRQGRQASGGREAVLLALAGARAGGRGAVEAVRRRRGQLVPLGTFATDPAGLQSLRQAVGKGRPGEIELRLPPHVLLEQSVTMPIAAEAGLQTALRWEMDRLTPFSADAVFWSYAVEHRDRARGRLAIRLRLVPKVAVDSVVAALTAAGLGPARLVAADAPERSIPLLGGKRRRPWLTAVAAGLLLVLAAVAAAAPFVRQELAFARLRETMASLRPEVEMADALRRRMAERAANADVVAAEAERVGDALQIVALTTTLLPDDTYLLGLSLRDRVLTITGQSAAAAQLIGILARDPSIKDPVFAAPVTRNEVSGAEMFTLRAEVTR